MIVHVKITSLEPVSETENESNSGMGRVDEGVEEFFTKRILPDSGLKGWWEESNPARATPPESGSTPTDPTTPLPPPSSFSSSSSSSFFPCNINTSPSTTTATTVTSPSVPTGDSPPLPRANVPSPHAAPPFPAAAVTPPASTPAPPPPSSSSAAAAATATAPPPAKNIKKKFGDFFAFKRARAGRAAKAGGGEGGGGGGGGGGGEGTKVKRTSIADLIRPLREAKEREKERERGARPDANVSNGAAVTEGAPAAADDPRDPAATVATPTPPPPLSSGDGGGGGGTPLPPPPTTTASAATAAAKTPSESGLAFFRMRGGPETARAGPQRAEGGVAPDGERRLKVTRRSLREGKSQSLILLTGLEAEDKESTHSKKHSSESTHSFEQRLQLMLHRIGVSKTPPASTKTSQNKEDELRKANSEGAILDKPQGPPVFSKPRTMSTSSDTRHPVWTTDRLRFEPLVPPKPPPAERPVGPLPPKPTIAAKPPLPPAPSGLRATAPGTPLGPSGPPQGHSAPPTPRGAAQAEGQTARTPPSQVPEAEGRAAPGPRLAPTVSPRRAPPVHDRSEKAQSATDESLPKPRQRMKPLPQRRAVSVHEDTLAMTQELKAVLQRSPNRHGAHRGVLATCTEHAQAVGQTAARGGGRAGEAGSRRVPGWGGGGGGGGGGGEEPTESKAEGGRTADAEAPAGTAPPLGDKTTKAPPLADKKAPPTATPGHKEPKPLPLSLTPTTPENQPPAKTPSPSTAQVAGPQTKARSPVPPPSGATTVPPSTAATPAAAAAAAALGRSTTQEKEREARRKEPVSPQHTGKAPSPGVRTDTAVPRAEE
ncbi:unnamed protein product [Arctogadus glacialis]